MEHSSITRNKGTGWKQKLTIRSTRRVIPSTCSELLTISELSDLFCLEIYRHESLSGIPHYTAVIAIKQPVDYAEAVISKPDGERFLQIDTGEPDAINKAIGSAPRRIQLKSDEIFVAESNVYTLSSRWKDIVLDCRQPTTISSTGHLLPVNDSEWLTTLEVLDLVKLQIKRNAGLNEFYDVSITIGSRFVRCAKVVIRGPDEKCIEHINVNGPDTSCIKKNVMETFSQLKLDDIIHAEVHLYGYEKHYKPPDHWESKLVRLFDEEKYTDFVLKVSGEEIKAHRIVLASKSIYFENMFNIRMREAETNEVEVPDFEPNIMRAMIKYMYKGKLEFDCKEEKEPNQKLQFYSRLMVAADKYQINNLKLDCEQALLGCMSTETANELMIFVRTYKAETLKKEIDNFMLYPRRGNVRD